MKTLVLACLLLLPSIVFAQVNIDECNGSPTACSVLSSTTSSTTTALVGGVVLTAVLGGNTSQALKQYLRDHAVAIRRDVSLGFGDTVADLALFLGVDGKKFGAWARKNRRVLLDAVSKEDAETIIVMTHLRFG